MRLALFFVALAAQAQTVEDVVRAAHERGEFNGVVVVTENGKVRSTAVAGYADRAAKIRNVPETVFRLASLTKQVTSLLVMQEVSAERLSLDQKANEFFPALPSVSIRQLLQHVSGLPNPSDGPDDVVPPFYLRSGADASDITKAALGFCSGTPKRAPGGKFEYNNCDYIVLGAILEKRTGERFADLVKQRVITQLGLSSWGMFLGDSSGAPRTAKGYQKNGLEDLFQNPATYGSSGGLYGNALDVGKWDTALLTNRLLSPEATEVMFTADPMLYGEALGSWAYDSPVTKPPIRIVERQGDIGGTCLLNLLIPQRNASIVIIANTENADLFNTYSQKGLGFEILKAFTANSPAK